MAKIIKVIKGAIADFINGLKIIFGKPKPGEGDRKLAKMSGIVMGQIPVYGKRVVQLSVIKSVEKDLKRAAKKSPKAVDDILNNALQTPEYMRMLRRLDLNESHMRVMAMEAKKKYA